MNTYWQKVKDRIAKNAEKLKKEKELKSKKKQRLYDRRRRAKKNYPKKTCPICGTMFKPRTFKTRFCGEPCRFRYMHLKNKGWTEEMIFNKTILKNHPDKAQLAHERILQNAIAMSPDLTTKVPVVIDSKTTIFIDPWKDPVQARKNYLIKFHSV